MSETDLDDFVKRARAYREQGRPHGFEFASFENRVSQWPPEWGNTFRALIGGDFDPPTQELVFDDLGVVVEPTKVEGDTVLRTAMTVLCARIPVQEKTIAAVKDAARRMNLLVGVLSVAGHGGAVRWWSHLTSGFPSGLTFTLGDGHPDDILQQVLAIADDDVRQRVTAAMYWIREPRALLKEQHQHNDVLAIYAGYWNAFELLVEAVNHIAPPSTPTRAEKNATIRARLVSLGDRVEAGDITTMFRDIIETPLRARAQHALTVCIGRAADEFMRECFDYQPKDSGLYAIRNAINHGSIDVDDPETAMLVDSRFSKLSVLVFSMLGAVLELGRT